MNVSRPTINIIPSSHGIAADSVNGFTPLIRDMRVNCGVIGATMGGTSPSVLSSPGQLGSWSQVWYIEGMRPPHRRAQPSTGRSLAAALPHDDYHILTLDGGAAKLCL